MSKKPFLIIREYLTAAHSLAGRRWLWGFLPPAAAALLLGLCFWLAGALQTSAQGVSAAQEVRAGLRIAEIQGSSHLSPLAGQSVTAVQGAVSALRSTGFYMQDLPDADPNTSDGIFVYLGSRPSLQAGDQVSVSGTVQEYYQGGVSSGGLSLTEIAATPQEVQRLASGSVLPAPAIIGSGGRQPPAEVIEDDASGNVETSGLFDPSQDGIDFYESLEGMYVTVEDPLVVGPTTADGEIPIVGDAGQFATLLSSRGALVIRPGDFNPERIILNDSIIFAEPKVHTGDRFSGSIGGVLDYSDGNFKLLNTSPLPAVLAGGVISETAAAPGADQLSVATFNVENLDPGDDPLKFSRLAGVIVARLRSPDLIVLEEVQDSSGALNDGVVTATLTYAGLVNAIQVAGGPQYAYREISPLNDRDGGEVGGNIRVGFLFRTDTGLSFVDRPGGDAVTPVAVTVSAGAAGLSLSPGRIEPDDPAFANSRKPLAGEFTFRGRTLFVIGNHLIARTGDDPLFGRNQPPVLSSEAKRIRQAQIIQSFVASLLAADPAADVIVLGDLNDFPLVPGAERAGWSEPDRPARYAPRAGALHLYLRGKC